MQAWTNFGFSNYLILRSFGVQHLFIILTIKTNDEREYKIAVDGIRRMDGKMLISFKRQTEAVIKF